MDKKISVVINTLNEEEKIARAIKSVSWADEVIVVDMRSEDKTIEVATRLGVKVFSTERSSYVEPARNFAVSKASHDWVLVLDPDEEVGKELAERLQELVASEIVSDYVRVPRKNLIFSKWMKATGWWPDYNIRFFKKGSVEWSNKIHIPPKTKGQGLDLPAEEKYAIIHHHYTSLSQYLQRLDRYTTIQAKELLDDGYKFSWADLIHKPLSEFLSRYFAQKGYEDGLHGLVMSLLQSFSFLIVYLKVWEQEKFKEQDLSMKKLKGEVEKSRKELDYWFKYVNLSRNPFKKFVQKIIN